MTLNFAPGRSRSGNSVGLQVDRFPGPGYFAHLGAVRAMSDPYLGEIRLVALNFAPVGWAFCNGQLLSVSDYPEVYQLIGTTYGGDGVTNFALPNLQSRLPIHLGSSYPLGSSGGAETVTLSTSNLPSHTHPVQASGAAASSGDPTGNLWASSQSLKQFTGSGTGNTPMASGTIAPIGGSSAHDNMVPYLCLNFIIALQGIYPSQS